MNKIVKIIVVSLVVALIALFAIEIFMLKRHPYFAIEEFPGFYAVVSFCSFVVLVVGAKFILRPLVFRKDLKFDD